VLKISDAIQFQEEKEIIETSHWLVCNNLVYKSK